MQQTLVTTDWLQDHLEDDNLRVVDIRGYVLPAIEPPPHYFNNLDDYKKSHIPGAVFIDWIKEITDPDSPHHAQVAPPERFAKVMSRAGIDADTFVVVYDTNNGMFAARLWWMLNYYGHTNVAVLHGGWDKWTAENRPTTAEIPTITPTTFEPVQNPAIYRTSTDVSAAIGTETILVDVRSPQEFAGEASRIERHGHIPGAINVPRKTLLNEDGTLKPIDELRTAFGTVGIQSNSEIVTYCNGGVSASAVMLALRIAGYDNVAMYDGSWKDWGENDSNPVE